MTVNKLAWPASSGAAALASSCLSESPVPAVVDKSAENTVTEYSLSTAHKLSRCKQIQSVENMGITYSPRIGVPVM